MDRMQFSDATLVAFALHTSDNREPLTFPSVSLAISHKREIFYNTANSTMRARNAHGVFSSREANRESVNSRLVSRNGDSCALLDTHEMIHK